MDYSYPKETSMESYAQQEKYHDPVDFDADVQDEMRRLEYMIKAQVLADLTGSTEGLKVLKGKQEVSTGISSGSGQQRDTDKSLKRVQQEAYRRQLELDQAKAANKRVDVGYSGARRETFSKSESDNGIGRQQSQQNRQSLAVEENGPVGNGNNYKGVVYPAGGNEEKSRKKRQQEEYRRELEKQAKAAEEAKKRQKQAELQADKDLVESLNAADGGDDAVLPGRRRLPQSHKNVLNSDPPNASPSPNHHKIKNEQRSGRPLPTNEYEDEDYPRQRQPQRRPDYDDYDENYPRQRQPRRQSDYEDNEYDSPPRRRQPRRSIEYDDYDGNYPPPRRQSHRQSNEYDDGGDYPGERQRANLDGKRTRHAVSPGRAGLPMEQASPSKAKLSRKEMVNQLYGNGIGGDDNVHEEKKRRAKEAAALLLAQVEDNKRRKEEAKRKEEEEQQRVEREAMEWAKVLEARAKEHEVKPMRGGPEGDDESNLKVQGGRRRVPAPGALATNPLREVLPASKGVGGAVQNSPRPAVPQPGSVATTNGGGGNGSGAQHSPRSAVQSNAGKVQNSPPPTRVAPATDEGSLSTPYGNLEQQPAHGAVAGAAAFGENVSGSSGMPPLSLDGAVAGTHIPDIRQDGRAGPGGYSNGPILDFGDVRQGHGHGYGLGHGPSQHYEGYPMHHYPPPSQYPQHLQRSLYSDSYSLAGSQQPFHPYPPPYAGPAYPPLHMPAQHPLSVDPYHVGPPMQYNMYFDGYGCGGGGPMMQPPLLHPPPGYGYGYCMDGSVLSSTAEYVSSGGQQEGDCSDDGSDDSEDEDRRGSRKPKGKGGYGGRGKSASNKSKDVYDEEDPGEISFVSDSRLIPADRRAIKDMLEEKDRRSAGKGRDIGPSRSVQFRQEEEEDEDVVWERSQQRKLKHESTKATSPRPSYGSDRDSSMSKSSGDRDIFEKSLTSESLLTYMTGPASRPASRAAMMNGFFDDGHGRQNYDKMIVSPYLNTAQRGDGAPGDAPALSLSNNSKRVTQSTRNGPLGIVTDSPTNSSPRHHSSLVPESPLSKLLSSGIGSRQTSRVNDLGTPSRAGQGKTAYAAAGIGSKSGSARPGSTRYTCSPRGHAQQPSVSSDTLRQKSQLILDSSALSRAGRSTLPAGSGSPNDLGDGYEDLQLLPIMTATNETEKYEDDFECATSTSIGCDELLVLAGSASVVAIDAGRGQSLTNARVTTTNKAASPFVVHSIVKPSPAPPQQRSGGVKSSAVTSAPMPCADDCSSDGKDSYDTRMREAYERDAQRKQPAAGVDNTSGRRCSRPQSASLTPRTAATQQDDSLEREVTRRTVSAGDRQSSSRRTSSTRRSKTTASSWDMVLQGSLEKVTGL